MNDGRVITRASVIVIDSGNEPVGLIRYDGGRYLRVHFIDGQWNEHPDWRIYDTIEAARKINPAAEYRSALDFVEGLEAL